MFQTISGYKYKEAECHASAMLSLFCPVVTVGNWCRTKLRNERRGGECNYESGVSGVFFGHLERKNALWQEFSRGCRGKNDGDE